MATLICQQYPELSIHIPASGGWRQFSGGKLEIDEDDPDYAVVIAEAERNPAIAVYVNARTCLECGQTFGSRAKLDDHFKETHFDKWLAREDQAHEERRILEIKSRPAGLVCDACRPPQVLGSEDALVAHIQILHTARPQLSDDGSGDPGGDGGDSRRPGEVGVSIPAATGTQADPDDA